MQANALRCAAPAQQAGPLQKIRATPDIEVVHAILQQLLHLLGRHSLAGRRGLPQRRKAAPCAGAHGGHRQRGYGGKYLHIETMSERLIRSALAGGLRRAAARRWGAVPAKWDSPQGPETLQL